MLDKKNELLLCFYHTQHSVGINQHAESLKIDFILDSSLNLDHVHIRSIFLMIQNKTWSIRGEIEGVIPGNSQSLEAQVWVWCEVQPALLARCLSRAGGGGGAIREELGFHWQDGTGDWAGNPGMFLRGQGVATSKRLHLMLCEPVTEECPLHTLPHSLQWHYRTGPSSQTP